MKWVLENWYLLAGGLFACGGGVMAAVKFCELSHKQKKEKVREWLVYAVTKAEASLGGGTGQLKLRQVYDLFIQRFPKIANAVSFAEFSRWVDEALIDMREMLEKNQAVSRLVKGEENGTD